MGTVIDDSVALRMKASSLTQRIGSALVLLPIIITMIWWSPWAVVASVAVLVVVGLSELHGAFIHLAPPPETYRFSLVLGALMALSFLFAIVAEALSGVVLTPLVATLAVIVSLSLALRQHARQPVLIEWALGLGAALYISVLSAHIVLMRLIETPLNPSPLSNLGLSSGAAWLFLACVITWLQDAMAYFVGKRWGHRKMAPVLSPNKTWEGAAGGLFGAVVGSLATVWLCGLPLNPLLAIILGVAGGIIGPLGDLAESMIKRHAGLKDVGHLIPGHGGMLDRVDALLFATPVVYYLVLLFMYLRWIVSS